MNEKTDVINIVPKLSLFEGEIQERSSLSHFDFFSYDWNANKYKRVLSFFRLMYLFFSKKKSVYCFHYVPINWLFLLSLMFKRNFVLYFWGSEFYGSIISSKEIEAHCIRKTPRLIEFQSSSDIPLTKGTFRKLRAIMTCYLASRSVGIVVAKKNYRYMRYCYWRFFKKKGFPNRLEVSVYGYENTRPSESSSDDYSKVSKNNINILVCHSASGDLNVKHTAHLLKELSRSYDINVYGFLSYSGGSEMDRNRIEDEYIKLFSEFSKSICFERDFLDYQKLDLALKNIDVAVFSCYRDEGVSLLSRFIMMGGIVSFNKFSINYSYFKEFNVNKLLSHDELLKMRSSKIIKLRNAQSSCNFSRPEFSINLLKSGIKDGL